MPKTFCATAALGALLALPAAAGAAEWKAVGPISSNANGQSSSILRYGVDGDGVLSVLFRDITIDDEPGDLHLLDRAPKGKLVPGQLFAATGLPAFAVGSDGERIAAYSGGSEGAQQVEVRTRQGTGAWSPPTVVGAGQQRVVSVDVKPQFAAWIETPTEAELEAHPDVRNNWNLWAAARTASGFAPAQKVATGEIRSFATAQDSGGDAVLGWIDEDKGIAYTARRPAGGAFGAPEPHVAPNLVATGFPILSVAPHGRAVMAWPAGGGAAAMVGDAGTGFGPVRVVSHDTSSYLNAVADDDGAAVSWVENPGSGGKVKAILVPPATDIASLPVRVVSPAGVPFYFFDQSATARGRTAFAWGRRVSGPIVVEARTVDANGKFTKAQKLSSRTYTSSRIVVKMSSRGEAWVAWGEQARDINRSSDGLATAKASSTNGVFGRRVTLPRGSDGIDLVELIAGKSGTMLMAYRRGFWYLRSYGE